MADSSNEHESIVGWGCEIADEWLTRGARNEIHICDSNMNGSYEREAISRRYADNETDSDAKMPRGIEAKSISRKMYCHAFLSEGEKVAVRAEQVTDTREGLSQISSLQNPPLSRISNAHWCSQRTATSSLGEVSSIIFENSCYTRHSEALQSRKNPAYYCNTNKLKGDNMNNLTETDHASMPLGIFASKLVSHKTNVGGVGTPPYVAKSVSLSDWQIRPTALKRVAFTLAEVLITLGIIGVVAALTIPSIVAHYKKQEVTTKLKTVESLFTQMLNFSIAENGDPQNWDLGASYGVDAGNGNAEKTLIRITEKYFLPYLKTSNYYGYVSLKDAGYPVYYKVDGSLQKWNLESSDAKYCIIELANGMTTFLRMNYSNEYTMLNLIIYVDINGKKAPNIWGRDTFEADIDVRKGKFYWSGAQYGREALKNFCADKYAYVCGALIWLDGYEIKPDYPIKI